MQKNGVGLEEYDAKFEFGFGGIYSQAQFDAKRCAVNKASVARGSRGYS
jgi:hypothetical protein